MKTVTVERDATELHKTVTLGTLRLQHETTHEIILIPTPSDDPNDPLNWYAKLLTRYRRESVLRLTCC
jgi:hypothetical protein